jgi:hypothetical protein
MNNSNADMMRVLGRIEGTINSLHDQVTKHVEDDDKVEVRVRKVERKQSWFMGGLAASWAAVGVVYKFFTLT